MWNSLPRLSSHGEGRFVNRPEELRPGPP
jgi:hypothetical protein